jgi:hypothetical protein
MTLMKQIQDYKLGRLLVQPGVGIGTLGVPVSQSGANMPIVSIVSARIQFKGTGQPDYN